MIVGFAAGLGLYLIFLLYHCVFRVKEGHLAVVTEFGAARKTPDGKNVVTDPPGLHMKRPWEEVVTLSVMEQNLDLSGQEGGSAAMAEDGTVLRLDSILRYVPDETELDEYLFGMKNPTEHITGLFTCLLRNEIANFRAATTPSTELAKYDFSKEAGSYAIIRRERGLLNQHIAEFCREKIGSRYGVRFNAVDVTDILPPDELADALNAVIQARSDAEAQYFRAEGECQQRVMAAERGVAIATARARAIETEILKLGGFLAELSRGGNLDAYVARRRSEVLSESRMVYMKEAQS